MKDFSVLSYEEQKRFSDIMFAPLSSAEQVRNWIKLFLGLEIPVDVMDSDSNSSPLDAIWQIYDTFKHNRGDVNPGFILMSSRESLKTISVAILEVLLVVHFKCEIGHASATEDQSAVALGYIENFFMSIQPLLDVAGWENKTKNKRVAKFRTPDGKNPYVKIIICSARGMNALHSQLLVLDELDLADPKAIKEGKNITGFSKGVYGIKVYLSTRKYAFGNMSKAIDEAPSMNYKILNWNILDVTEKCMPARHLPDGPKQDMYVAKNLPLKQIYPDEYELLGDSEKTKYELIKDTYEGCRNCILLPVCKKKLAAKPDSAVGGFYKPIVSVIQKFRENDPDTAEAQLLCWKPGSEGLIYPRFSTIPGKGNVITLKEAYTELMGPNSKTSISEMELLHYLKEAQIPIYAGVDWGFTHDSVILIVAKLPNGDIWVIDCFAAPGLEFSDVLLTAMSYRDKYDVQKWFCDQAMPSSIKSFNKNGMKSPRFTKDVLGGIDSIRSKIVGTSGHRFLKIIATPNTKKVISAIQKHRFMMDGQGNLTTEPDDDRGIADICDALRYIGQNLFPVKGSQKPEVSWTDIRSTPEDNPNPGANQQMQEEITKRIQDGGAVKGGTGRKGGFHFNF